MAPLWEQLKLLGETIVPIGQSNRTRIIGPGPSEAEGLIAFTSITSSTPFALVSWSFQPLMLVPLPAWFVTRWRTVVSLPVPGMTSGTG